METKNQVIIDGIGYELVRDPKTESCENCALREQCQDSYMDSLCVTLFSKSINDMHFYRFAKIGKVDDSIRDKAVKFVAKNTCDTMDQYGTKYMASKSMVTWEEFLTEFKNYLNSNE